MCPDDDGGEASESFDDDCPVLGQALDRQKHIEEALKNGKRQRLTTAFKYKQVFRLAGVRTPERLFVRWTKFLVDSM